MADAARDNATDPAETSRSNHNGHNRFVFGDVADQLTRLNSMLRLERPAHLTIVTHRFSGINTCTGYTTFSFVTIQASDADRQTDGQNDATAIPCVALHAAAR